MCFNTKKIISVLLTIAIIFSVVTTSVLATEETSEVPEIVAYDENAEEQSISTDESVMDFEDEIYVDNNNEALQTQYDEAVLQAFSDAELQSDTVAPSGEGTEENPYIINTEEELISFAVGNIEDGLTAYWELHSDIELTADTWAPIGAYTKFTGYFDGKGHTISSSKLFQSTAMSGIFGQNAGLIKNLNVNVTIEEVATNTGTLCAVNNGIIENCHVTGSITTQENKNIGGLCGWNENGTILNCSSSVVITAPNAIVGGLVGYNKNATVKYSYTYNKTADSENEEEELIAGKTVGGLIGYALNDNNNCTSLISNCYTLAKIKGGSRVGGLIGYCDVYNGTRGYLTIEYCYAKGVITAGTTKGGLVGAMNSTDRVGVRYCYFNNINNYNKYGYAVSLLDITKKTTFYDWNFDEIWAIDADINNGYPYIDFKGSETISIDGGGTEENPYIITNEKQLCYLASEKLPLSAYYKLGNDVEVTANYWTPIAAMASSVFSGVFDGDGHSVTGVHTENIYYDNIGLFGRNSGTIKNLTVEAWFNGNANTGGLVAYNSGTIENCNSYIDGTELSIYATERAGGLVGFNENGVIKLSHSSSTVNSGSEAGGLVGFARNSIVKYCYSTSNVTGKNAGGLIGWIQNDDSSFHTMVSNCYAMGKISGSSRGGGLIGFCDVYNTTRGYLTVEYCYARGLVIENGKNGGLIGEINTADRNVIRYSYYNIANTGNSIGFGVKASTLKQKDTLYGWDFDNIWKIQSGVNSGYPILDIRGETPVNTLKGNGEEDRPYLIYTQEDLRSLVFDTYGQYDLSVKHFYKLMNDIEITANFWTPIGANGTNSFNGIFDGNGHKITGVKLSNSHYNRTGLFGINTGTIKNLTVEANISGKVAGVLCGENRGTIENCVTMGNMEADAVQNEMYIGGIAGLSSGTISKSSSSATVSCSGWEAGGITGRLYNGVINYSYTTSDVNGKYAGGLAGRVMNDNSSFTSKISNCYSTGRISGTEYAGGLVGYSDVYNTTRGYIVIEYSYSTSIPEGSGYKGGIVGSHNTRERNFIRYSYYNNANTGNKCGFSATDGQMIDKNLYYMWDFKNIWDIDSAVNGGYPYLNVTGKTPVHYLDGYGDEDDPYMIETEEDLWTLVLGTYDFAGNFYFQLQNDIEVTAQHWTPIGGNYEKSFDGIFDGNGYTISGISLTNSELYEQGLFGNNEGTIKNLNVIANIEGNERTGLICAVNNGTIDNCSSVGTVGTYNTGSEVFVGGLTGINCGTISNSYSTAPVAGINFDTGGLVGRNWNGLIYQSCATGNVTGKNSGGLVGRQYNDNTSTTTTIRNCYATGNVYGSQYAGGLVGFSDVYNMTRGYTAIENAYSLGVVTGKTTGGLVGYSNESVRNSILSSYYNQTNTELSDIDRGTPLEDYAMKLQSSYVGWDYNDVWSIDQNVNNGYPTLIGQNVAAITPSIIIGDVTDFSINVSLVGENKTGVVYAILRENNKAKEIKFYSITEPIVVNFDTPKKGNNVEIFWWNAPMSPVCKSADVQY